MPDQDRDLKDLTSEACATLLEAARKAPRDEQRQLSWLAARLREGARVGMRFDALTGIIRVDVVMPEGPNLWGIMAFGQGFSLASALEEARAIWAAHAGSPRVDA